MDIEEFKKEFIKYLKIQKRELDEEKINKFYKYMILLIEWNKKMNLTAIVEPKEIILKHFIDSISIEDLIKENSKIVDVGTGAGFPGIPLKILRDDIKITLVDSLNKRLVFLKEVINQLELKNVEIIHTRAEDIGKDKMYREKFDIAISRAVANLSTLSEYLLPLVKEKGIAISMKGSNCKEELKNSKSAIDVLGGKIIEHKEFLLPLSDNIRNIIVIKKIKNTPSKFPRKAGVPAKEPIK